LRRRWLQKQFPGQVSTIPPLARSVKAALKLAKKSERIVIFVRTNKVEKGLKRIKNGWEAS
jgi:hypothetical protein